MSLEGILTRMREVLPDLNLKRRRSSNCPDSGPPPKLLKNVQEHRFVRDEHLRHQSTKKSILKSMGSILSKFRPYSNGRELPECEEFSDGDDVIILRKIKRPDRNASRHCEPLINYQLDKMHAANNISSAANRPPPGLIHKTKWSQIPDLQKMVPIVAQSRMNGQLGSDTSSIRNHVLNGTSMSFKPPSSQHIDSTIGRNNSNYSASIGSKFPSLMSLKPVHNAAEDKLRFEKLLKSAVPDWCVADSVPTSKRPTTVPNHISPRPPLRPSGIHIIDDDLYKKHEDVRRRFSDASITEHKVTPINTMRLKVDASLVCKKQYPDIVKEKYSPAIAQRHEKISQQEEASKRLTSIRMNHCHSYEKLTPGWATPSIVIFDEDIEEKIDDFPEFNDAQRQTIRQAMAGNSHATLISKFNIQITRSHIHTLQWEPTLAWLNDEVINFYMSLLTERGELRANDGYPKVYAMNTFFTQRLFQGGHSAVKRWTKKVDLFACDIIPVPVHVGNVHWCMAIINMKEKTIKYYDSMGAPNHRVLSELEDYLKKESLDKRKIEFDTSGWKTENVTNNPRQENGSDCGVFSCMTAEFICRNRPVAFNQQHMNYFRQKMVLEICTGSLLL